MDDKQAKRNYDHARYLRLKAERMRDNAPDPMEQMNDIERAYLAGLLDGEGAFYIGVIGPKPHKTVYPIVAVGMTHRPTMEWISEKLGNKTICFHNHTTSRRKSDNWRKQWIVKLSGQRAQTLCRIVLPYLITKRQHAEIILRFPSDQRIRPGQHISEEVNQSRYALRDEMLALNARGRTTTTPDS